MAMVNQCSIVVVSSDDIQPVRIGFPELVRKILELLLTGS